ncbi:hypothetical protein GCM10010211_16520 [Streptomyces albospinus]|uniref:Transposase DDE domain-containing protein n=1 Tax=Streptomyces albospinus TaxID=285515 RepID=A0ABQ2UUT9_9ACTN|nr:hypothetical protein GCM10010211_16520 [Streptomyces albospinus]
MPTRSRVAFIDIDSTHKRVFGRTEQGAQVGRFKGVRTLHPLLAAVCTPTSHPVVAAVRLRQGKSADGRGAPRFVTEAVAASPSASHSMSSHPCREPRLPSGTGVSPGVRE